MCVCMYLQIYSIQMHTMHVYVLICAHIYVHIFIHTWSSHVKANPTVKFTKYFFPIIFILLTIGYNFQIQNDYLLYLNKITSLVCVLT